MIYLTDTIGMDSGIVGTLMMVSKLFDGVTDIFFGSMIDKTKSRMGKARPWMLWAYIGCSAMIVMLFIVPAGGKQVCTICVVLCCIYIIERSFFILQNNIAYSALTSLITKNDSERVQMGSIRFMFAFGTSMLIQTITVDAVEAMGGGAAGWRTIAILYAVIGLIVNTISVLSVKELPAEELEDKKLVKKDLQEEKYGLKSAAKMLVSNKYYIIICVMYILMQIFTATLNMGIFFMTYILGDASLLGVLHGQLIYH